MVLWFVMFSADPDPSSPNNPPNDDEEKCVDNGMSLYSCATLRSWYEKLSDFCAEVYAKYCCKTCSLLKSGKSAFPSEKNMSVICILAYTTLLVKLLFRRKIFFLPAEWENRQSNFSFCSFCQFANFTISFCQQNGKIDKVIFHSAHSARLLTLPFHSASRMGRMGKSTKTNSFCSFCQFANFTISFCQQNGQNGKIDKDIFILLILLILPVC